MVDVKKILDRNEKLFLIFKTAIEAESAAQKTYQEAMEYTDDPLLLNILRQLHHDEARHEETLKEHYKLLRQNYDSTGKLK